MSIREQINPTPSLLKGKGIMKPFKGKIMSYVNCFVKLPLKCASVQQNCNTWSINFSITLWSISASNQSTWLMDWKHCFGCIVSCLDFKVQQQHLFPIQNQIKRNRETLIETGRNQSVSRNQTAILAGTLKSIISRSLVVKKGNKKARCQRSLWSTANLINIVWNVKGFLWWKVEKCPVE